MSKNIFVRFGDPQIYERFDPDNTKPIKVSIPDDSLIFKCSSDCIYTGKHRNSFHYILVSKSMSKKQVEKLENLDKRFVAITKVMSTPWSFDYIKFNGYSAVIIKDCLISQFQENTDNLGDLRLDGDKLNSMLFNKPVYTVCLRENGEIVRALKLKKMLSPGLIMCDECDYIDKTISSDKKVFIENIQCRPITKECARISPQPYCKDLFDEIMYSNLSNIYDGFKEYKLNYDLDWLKNNIEDVPVQIIPVKGASDEESKEISNFSIKSPKVGYWNDIFKFKKRLPKKQKQ